MLLAGDATGQVKATTVGGIIFGGNAALMAADVIEGNLVNGEPLEEYEKRFMAKFGKDMRLHSLINRLYSSLSAQKTGRAVAL